MSRISSTPLLLVTTPSCSLKSNFILPSSISSWRWTLWRRPSFGPPMLVSARSWVLMRPMAPLEESADDAFGSDEAVFRVGALEEFVEQKEDRWGPFREVADLAQASNLGVEAGVAFLKRVVDEDACAYVERCELQTAARTGAPAMARTVLMPTARMSVLLPDMLEPLMRRARVSPTRTSLRTHFAAGMRGWPSARR